MRNYAAITIGPIIETISSVSTPGALWCASGMFSDLASSLCRKILGQIPEAKIISPAYDEKLDCKDGIGRWHDRIFFHCPLGDDELYEKLKSISEEAKNELADNICKAIGSNNADAVADYIRNYIQINWITAPQDTAEADGKNCILNLSKYLDSAELSANFSHNETSSPLTRLFNGEDGAKNSFIKKCWLVPEGKKIQILDSFGKIRDISSIANPNDKKDGKKIRSYFAVVQSDGDGMGKCLESCSSADDVKAFSQVCIKYTQEASELIGAYGGLTVYAGGDDLLFLAPLEGLNGENILTLCKNITQTFNESFSDFSSKSGCTAPTLSFGLTVNFTSSPLYEAVKEVIPLLMHDAKSGEKNKIAIAFHKHSGQSSKFVAPNRWEDNTPLGELEKLIGKSLAATSNADETIRSVLYALDTFSSAYELCRSKNIDTQNFFDNTFDNDGQAGNRAYINSVKKFGDIIASDGSCLATDGNAKIAGSMTDKETNILNAMLRFAKLYSERGDG
ncbi:MAG: hypothetical protein IJZ07_09290 [Clostridia bacterium]|nr:hypothetical protein [Clostridia bacterium]